MASEIEFLGLSAEEAESVADEWLSGGLYVKILERSAAVSAKANGSIGLQWTT
jgi:hypothetical protein